MKNFSIFEEKFERAKPTEVLIADVHNFTGKRLFLFECWLQSNGLYSGPALSIRGEGAVKGLNSGPALPNRVEGACRVPLPVTRQRGHTWSGGVSLSANSERHRIHVRTTYT